MPDAEGCTTTTYTTTVTTSYTAHHGTYNSNGQRLSDPPSTTETTGTSSSKNCPFSAPLYENTKDTAGGCAGLYNNQADTPPAIGVGTTSVVPQGDGSVLVSVHLRGAEPGTVYMFEDACIRNNWPGYLLTDSNGNGDVTFRNPQNGQTSWVINGGPVSDLFNPYYYVASKVITVPRN